MRRVLYGDVRAAARALLAAPQEARGALLIRLFAEAETADLHRLDTGRAHPQFGTGSLMSAALAHCVAREPYLDDPAYAACMAEVFEALVARAGQGPS
jgi:hypothetical protein